MVSLFGRGFDSHQLHLLLPPAGHSIIPLPPACGRPPFLQCRDAACRVLEGKSEGIAPRAPKVRQNTGRWWSEAKPLLEGEGGF